MQSIYKNIENGSGLLYAWMPGMHTRIDVMIIGEKEEQLQEVVQAMSTCIHRLESIANFYDSRSELYLLNREAANHPVHVSEELFEMISQCILYHDRTLGYFDIAVQSDNYTRESIRQIILSTDDQTVCYRSPGIKVDLSGYVKGYALDKISGILSSYNVNHALVNMGNSSVMARGNHPYGKGWKIAYDNNSGGTEDQYIHLYDECFTTSGNNTVNREHIIDPHTGSLVQGKRKVSTITTQGAVGEVLSTTLFIASPEEKIKISGDFSNELFRILEGE